MRLLCVIDHLGSGGAQRQLVNIAVDLKARGHDVEFFLYYPHDHYRNCLDEVGIPVHFSLKPSRLSLAPLVALRKVVGKGGYDVVLAFLETPSFYAEVASLGWGRPKLVVSERNVVHGGKVSLPGRLLYAMHRCADAVTTNSYTHRNWLAAQFPWLEPRLSVIPNGTDLKRFHPPAAGRAGEPGRARFLGVGRISRQKNLGRLVEALAVCESRAPGAIRIDWAGDRNEPECAAAVEGLVVTKGLAHAWKWLGERRDVDALMRAYDALVLPSLYEGMPNVVCEALASGLPVLASRVSDNPMLVRHAENGLLFSPESVEEIANALLEFASASPAARRNMEARARAYAENSLSLERCAASYEGLLAGLCSRPAGGAKTAGVNPVP